MLEIMKNEKYFENWCLFDYKFMANVPYASCVSGVGSTSAEMEDLTCFIIYIIEHYLVVIYKNHFQTCLQNVSD